MDLGRRVDLDFLPSRTKAIIFEKKEKKELASFQLTEPVVWSLIYKANMDVVQLVIYKRPMVDLRDITEEYSLLFSCLRHCHKYQEEEDFSLSVQHISALLVRPKFNVNKGPADIHPS